MIFCVDHSGGPTEIPIEVLLEAADFAEAVQSCTEHLRCLSEAFQSETKQEVILFYSRTRGPSYCDTTGAILKVGTTVPNNYFPRIYSSGIVEAP